MIKKLCHNQWISLNETECGYVFSRNERSNGAIVAFLIIDKDRPFDVLGRYENTPCHFDGISLCSFTGGVENNHPSYTAVKEVLEEAGYVIEKTDLIDLGTVRYSKSSDTIVYLYLVDVTGKTPTEIKGDGSKGEEGAYTKWINFRDAIHCKDPLMITLIARYASSDIDSLNYVNK